MRERKQRLILLSGLLLGIAIHGLALWSINDMAISDCGCRAKVMLSHFDKRDGASRKQEKERRTEQLRMAFKEPVKDRHENGVSRIETTAMYEPMSSALPFNEVYPASHPKAIADDDTTIAFAGVNKQSSLNVDDCWEIARETDLLFHDEVQLTDQLLRKAMAPPKLSNNEEVSYEQMAMLPAFKVDELDSCSVEGGWLKGLGTEAVEIAREKGSKLPVNYDVVAVHEPVTSYQEMLSGMKMPTVELPINPMLMQPVSLEELFSAMERHRGASNDSYRQYGAVAGSNDFTAKVSYCQSPQDSQWLFKIVLMPKEEAAFKRIKHNVFFLIDRSHSIDSDRYEMSKGAVLRALTYLKDGDAFNVVVFDKHAKKLSQECLPWSKESLLRAYEFLRREKHGGIFASTDLYSSLGSIIPETVAEDEVNTVILLSDGDTHLNIEQQRHTIGRWTDRNGGKVSLYCVAVADGDNLPLLNLLSSLNKGRLHYSTKHQGLATTLIDLMQAIRNPIGKEIIASVVKGDGFQKIKLYPGEGQLPHLYENMAYTIYGSTDRLENFYLFLQGKYYDKCLDIKQLVSFTDATYIEDDSLHRLFALHKAHEIYSSFLRDGGYGLLTQAKRMLSPYGIPSPFGF